MLHAALSLTEVCPEVGVPGASLKTREFGLNSVVDLRIDRSVRIREWIGFGDFCVRNQRSSRT